jgi:hypothetical protein
MYWIFSFEMRQDLRFFKQIDNNLRTAENSIFRCAALKIWWFSSILWENIMLFVEVRYELSHNADTSVFLWN